MQLENNNAGPHGFSRWRTLPTIRGGLTKIAWSPDGTMLAAGSTDHGVWLWNVDKDEPAMRLEGHRRVVGCVAWSPDGKMLASGSDDPMILIWDTSSGTLLRKLNGHTENVTSVAWSPTGTCLASGSDDATVQLWNIEQDEPVRTLNKHVDVVLSVAWSPDGKTIASASFDGTIALWNGETGELRCTLEGHVGRVYCLAWSPDGTILASGANDKTIRLWNPMTGERTTVIQGHEAGLLSISFSQDGRLFASRGRDATIRLWRCDTWQTIADYHEAGNWPYSGLAFHPINPDRMAALGEYDNVINIWDLRVDELLRYEHTLESTYHTEESISYATAKIALVGKQGVGKTTLGWRLVLGNFKAGVRSTHGQQFWLFDALHTTRNDGTECEAVLWDFAGQPVYHLIHALFLDDVDLTLVLFDPTNIENPLQDVQFWLKQLPRNEGRLCPAILVAARLDTGVLTVLPAEMDVYCQTHGISGGYVATSAYTGQGINELIARIKQQINWDSIAPTNTSTAFKQIKRHILSLKVDEAPSSVFVTYDELRNWLQTAVPDDSFSDSDIMGAVRNLANHGYVSTIRTSSGDEAVLITPELLTKLAASFVLTALGDDRGLGVLEEHRLLYGGYHFTELDGLSEQEQEIMLDAVTTLFLTHNICFRESLGNQTFLVFPSLINRKRPVSETNGTEDDASYIVSGAVENVYASLVVRLAYTTIFMRTAQWQNQAEYEMGPGEVCGFRQIAEQEGQIELVLYYSAETPSNSRNLFQALVEDFLRRRKNVRVRKYPRVICQKCKYPQERSEVVKRVEEKKSWLFCANCGKNNRLHVSIGEVMLSQTDEIKIEQETSLTRIRTEFEATLVGVKGFVRDRDGEVASPSCFISYAWGNPQHERWVCKLASDLRNAGIAVILDRFDNPEVGRNIARFVERIEKSNFIIAVGTTLYKQKYENKVSATGSVVAAEVDLINLRLLSTEQEKNTVLPLLLEGDEKISLPPLLRGRNHYSFVEEKLYFVHLLDLILTLYGIRFDDPAIDDLREKIRLVTGTAS